MKSKLYTLKGILNLIFLILTSLAFSFRSGHIGQPAKGEVVYMFKNKPLNLTVTNGQYLTGPDQMEPSKTIRRLLFTANDLTPKVTSCATMKCLDADFVGLQVDITDSPRLLYWLVLNNQLVQYSGTARHEALTLTENSPERLAGTLVIDDTQAGGPRANISFDLKLSRAFDK